MLKRYKSDIDIGDADLKNSIIKSTESILYKRMNGTTSAYELRQSRLLANTLSKKSNKDIEKQKPIQRKWTDFCLVNIIKVYGVIVQYFLYIFNSYFKS